MENKSLHVTLSPKTKKHLDQIRKNNGLSSYSSAINWLSATDRLSVLLRDLIQKGKISGHNIYVQEGKTDVKLEQREGKCERDGCSKFGMLTLAEYTEEIRETGEIIKNNMYQCDKCLKDNYKYV